MSFNDGFSTQGIPYITGSDGQVLTWSDALQQWISADSSGGGGGSFTGVHLDPTNPNLEGVGILSSPLKVSDNINLSSVTASFNGDGSQLTNIPASAVDLSGVAKLNGGNSFTGDQNLSGNLDFIQRSSIRSIPSSSGDYGSFSTLELIPDTDALASGQYLVIDPTSPQHIHIRAGGLIDNADATLILGGEKANVTVRDQNNAYIEDHHVLVTTTSASTTNTWIFQADGFTSMPGDVGANSFSASVGFSGRLYDTASYALDADQLDGKDSTVFARLDIDNNFTGNQSVTGYVSASAGLTGSAYGIRAEYTDITASNITASDVITNYINFRHSTDPSWDNGRLWYNNATHELNYWTEVNGFNVKLGQQLVQRCKNDQGIVLTKGKIVHISGSLSSTDTPRVKLADWSNDNLSANTLGMVAEDISIGGDGYVVVQGILKSLDTHLISPGAVVYLSSSGDYTTQKPSAPKHTVSIGQVVRSANNGSIYVSIQNGYELGELHDVSTNGKFNNDLFIWDSTIPAWKNSNTLGGYTFSGVNTFQNSVTGTSAYFSGDVKINGTASISHLDTINQSSLVIGDKYIVIMSGGVDHVGLDGAGILYGSGSTGPTVDENGANAYIKYRNSYDKLEIFPGLSVSGSLTASSGVSGSFIGDGSGLVNIPSTAVNLSNYATNSGVTASFAALNSANTFNANQTVTGSVYVTSAVSASQITGSFSGNGAGLTNLPVGITLTTNNTTGSATLVGSTLNIPTYVGLVPPLSATEIFRGAIHRNNTITYDQFGGFTIISAGSATAQSVSNTNYQTKQIRMKYIASAVSTGRYTGVRDGTLWYLGGGFRYVCGFGVTDTNYGAGCRQFYGMSTSSADLTYTDTVTVDSLLNLFGVGSDAADTNLQIIYNDGVGTASKIDLGSNFLANRTAGAAMTTVYYVELYNPPNSSNVYYKVTNGELNISSEGVITTNIPSSTVALNCFASRCMGTPTTGTGEFCLTRFGVYSI